MKENLFIQEMLWVWYLFYQQSENLYLAECKHSLLEKSEEFTSLFIKKQCDQQKCLIQNYKIIIMQKYYVKFLSESYDKTIHTEK